MFWVKKATAAVYSAVALFALGVGVGLSTHTDRGTATAQEKAKEPTKTPTVEEQIRVLEEIISSAETAKGLALESLDGAERLFAKILLAPDSRKEEIADARLTLNRFKQNYEQSLLTIERARKEIVELKAQKHPVAQTRRAELERELASAQAAQKLFVEKLTVAQLHETEMLKRHKISSAEFEAASKATLLAHSNFGDNSAKVERLRDELAKMRQNSNGYIELTVRGTAGAFEFEIYEVPLHDGTQRGAVLKYGPVKTRDRVSLATLLKRAKADLTAPLDVRVIVESQVTLGVGPQWALEACAKAGYDTVKFTGYVFGGGFAQQLKADEKGEVKGYTKYDAKPVKPAELAKEIAEGMRRF